MQPTYGQNRRATLEDSLGSVQTQRATVPGAPVQGVAAPVGPVQNNFSTQVQDAFRGFLDKERLGMISAQRDRSEMDGQLAAIQGRTYEQVQMQGDPVQLDGWRAVTAETAAAKLFAEQAAAIQSTDYSLGPDEYRARISDSFEAALATAPDDDTRRLLAAQFAERAPRLVQEQLLANLDWQEKVNYETLESAIPTLASDPASHAMLIDFATGAEGSATAGMTPERRQAAVTSGIVRAFANDEPGAYRVLAQAGLLQNLPADQARAIEGARVAYESKVRAYYDEAYSADVRELENQIRTGQISPEQAAARRASLEAERDVRVQSEEVGRAYSAAAASNDARSRAIVIQTEEARLRGDYRAMANLTLDSLAMTESGNRNINGPVVQHGANAGDRALGRLQVMPNTVRNPGFGITPGDPNNPADVERVGRQYWQAMITRYEGDIEASLIAYNAGPGNADNWLEAGRDYSVLPDREQTEPYVQRFMGHLNRQQEPSAEEIEARARADYEATSERVGLDAWNNAQLQNEVVDAEFRNGRISYEEWRAQRDQNFRQWRVQRTRAEYRSELEIVREQLEQNESRVDTENRINLQAALDTDEQAMELLIDQYISGNINGQELAVARDAYIRGVFERYAEYGVQYNASDITNRRRAMSERLDKALTEREQYNLQTARIDVATGVGAGNTLSQEDQVRALRDIRNSVRATVQEQFDSSALDAEQASIAMGDAYIQEISRAGLQDPQAARLIAGALSGPLLSADGTLSPNPDAVQAVRMYYQAYAANSAVAERYIPDSARARFEAIRAEIGEMPSDPAASMQVISDAVQSIGVRETALAANVNTTRYLASDEVRSQVNAAVDEIMEFNDVGLLQGMFNSDADMGARLDRTDRDTERLFSDDAKQEVRVLIEDEVERILASTAAEGIIAPREVVGAAQRQIQRRVAFVGGDLIVAPRGESIYEVFAGNLGDAAMSQAGSLNSAFSAYIVDRGENDPEWGPAVSTATSEDLGPVADIAIGLAQNVPVVGTDGRIAAAGAGEAIDTSIVGHRSYTATYDSTEGVVRFYFDQPGSADYSDIGGVPFDRDQYVLTVPIDEIRPYVQRYLRSRVIGD